MMQDSNLKLDHEKRELKPVAMIIPPAEASLAYRACVQGRRGIMYVENNINDEGNHPNSYSHDHMPQSYPITTATHANMPI